MTPRDFYNIARRVWARAPAHCIDFEDALQAAVIRCWQYRDRFDEARGKAGTYFSIVAWTEIRRLADKVGLVRRARDRACDAKEPTVDAVVLREELDWLRRALPPDDAEVLIPLHAGETLKAIGARLGLTREQIRHRKNRAMVRLTRAAQRDRVA